MTEPDRTVTYLLLGRKPSGLFVLAEGVTPESVKSVARQFSDYADLEIAKRTVDVTLEKLGPITPTEQT